ncbi:MAG TPA: DUF1289 domain-containing protein [Rhizomicrobium sp.]|nr:DUF1289 domain-containing protein [Rhizomicrobium sp.]
MTIESPCRQICTYESRSGLCTGCGRTLDEIARWSEISGEERRRIMAELPARLAKHSRD